MNNETGSGLQKASFVLLVLIAVALAYLVVRERLESQRQRADAQVAEAARSSASENADVPRLPTKSSFAPLRPGNHISKPRVVDGSTQAPPRNHTVSSVESGARTASADASASVAVPVATRAQNLAVTSGSSSFPDRTVSGRVFLRGAPPPEKPVTLDPMCARMHPRPITTRHFMVSEDRGLRNVFVYMKINFSDDSPQDSVPLFDNVNCEFQPYVFGVRVRQPFQIRNSDSFLHNVHALPKQKGNPEFNVGLPVAGMTLQKTFNAPEIFVQMKCEVHPWMFAYVGVVNHRWFTVTDTNGNFTLPVLGLPGRYKVAAVHVKAGEEVQEIEIDRDKQLPALTFTLDVPKALAQTLTH